MKTVGELLSSTRKKLGISLVTISEKTKIQLKFIRALEDNDYKNLPESAFVKGFIGSYAKMMGKDPKTFLAIFRRDYGEDDKGKVIPRGLVSPINQPKFRWTPKLTAIVASIIITVLFSSYLIFQFRVLSGVPNLTINTPQDDQQVPALVTVEGSTSSQATVMVNNKKVEVKDDGSFSETIGLTPGTHTITIEAKSRTNKTKIIQKTVNVE